MSMTVAKPVTIMPLLEIASRMSESKQTEPTENTPTLSKRDKFVLNLFAVLGLINLFAYLVTQNSYVAQNIYWVYGIITFIDGLSFFFGCVIVDDYRRQKSHP